MASSPTRDPMSITLDDFSSPPLPSVGSSALAVPWRLRAFDKREALMMAQNSAVDPILARVLAARGIQASDVEAYLAPSLRQDMPDPDVLQDMPLAAKTIADVIVQGKALGVFGDYDVDGVTASAIIRTYCDKLQVPVHVYLPDRITEGYGPSIDAFRTLKNQGADLVVTVDCGAAAHQVIEEAASDGIDVVVIDHHLMDGPPPEGAKATVNPNRLDDISDLKNLSAAGVAFMTMVAVNRELRARGFFNEKTAPDLLQLLDLTALGLVCDVMALTGLTRTLVAQGLKILDQNGNQGLRALAQRAGAKGPASTYHLGFLLGPRINAAGRIGHARMAFELLVEQNPGRCRQLAEELHVLNAGRQEIEAEVQEAALREIERSQRHHDEVIVTAGEGWHPGVIGIVAGRIKEIQDKPVIVIGTEKGLGKGSGRSIRGVDLGGAIVAAREEGVLTSGGGHEMAAGLSVEEKKIDRLRQFLNDRLKDAVIAARAQRHFEIDSVIASQAVTKSYFDLLAAGGPYGMGNPEPVFMLEDMTPRETRVVGKGHISLSLLGGDGTKVRAIAFRAADNALGEILTAGRSVHIVGKIRPDDWRGGDAAQFQIADAAFA